MALLLSLPIAFVALVPASAVSGALKTVLDVIAFVFPFRAALQAVSNAFSGTSPGIGWPLVHLARADGRVLGDRAAGRAPVRGLSSVHQRHADRRSCRRVRCARG